MNKNIQRVILAIFISVSSGIVFSQTTIMGVVQSDEGERLAWIDIVVDGMNKGATSNAAGDFTISGLPKGSYQLISQSTAFHNDTIAVELKDNNHMTVRFELEAIATSFEEVVVSGTMTTVRKSDSPVPIGVCSKEFCRSNPAPPMLESLGQVNGVKPSVTCSVSNAGDLLINGLEGPNTMILIDGIPIVSGLSTVY